MRQYEPADVHTLFFRGDGDAFCRWRQQARLFAAFELLAQHESVTNVAIAVGYDSLSAFIDRNNAERVFGGGLIRERQIPHRQC